jgi:2-polyprenyl-3-methyl-5-hydroxy-6-metoxy-1,4-benzoquinol methylase
MSDVTREQSREYYENFSLAVGERDWLSPNLRHEQLKLLIRDLLRGRRAMRIADIGCGVGVMTDYLARYGDVVGVDFSTAAISAAKRLSGRPRFIAGGIEALPDAGYDLITLFDVLEHIPQTGRPDFISQIRARLADGGLLFFSTPSPSATRSRREAGDPSLQIIDEQVELADVIAEAAAVGLQLINFKAYDVWAGSPEYQAMVFTPTRGFSGTPTLRSPTLTRIERRNERNLIQHERRIRLATRCLLRGRFRTALWLLRARSKAVQS